MKLKITASLLTLTLTGCSWFAHRAKHIEPPSAIELHAKRAELDQAVSGAKDAIQKAGTLVAHAHARHGEAVASHVAEKVLTHEIAASTESLKLRVTVELRPEVDALAAKVGELEAQASTTDAALSDTGSAVVLAAHELTGAEGKLTVGERAAAEIRTTIGPRYEAQVVSIVEKANATEIAYADTSKKLMWYRAHWWGAWLVLVLGIIGSVAFYFLKIAAK